jgi:vacuolar-type H+-ATPase subunit C/Vma6
MIGSVGFSFIFAKLHGMRARMYEGPRLAALASLRNPFEMISAMYPRLEERSLRGFERRLASEHVRELNRVRTLLDAQAQDFFTWQLQRYRIENLKVLLRAWKSHQSLEEVQPFLVELPARYALPVERLLGASKLPDFIALVPDRRFRDGIRRGSAQFQETNKLFYVEAGLDAAYFHELCLRASHLGEADRNEITRAIRMEMLTYNVLFAMRGRLNYGLTPDEVNEFLPRGPSPAPTGARYEPMLRAEGFAAMLAAMPDRKVLLGNGPDPADLGELQKRLAERLYQVANNTFYRSVLHMGCVVGFYYLKRVELNNLVRTAELLRQGRSGEDIERELIRLPEE